MIVQMSDDIKYGYNARKQLCMCAWLSVPNLLREDYVGVVIEES